MADYRQPDGAVTTDILLAQSAYYYVERWDNEPPRNRWRLVYPDGEYQRTRTKGEAIRLAELHANNRDAWTREVKGDGAQ